MFHYPQGLIASEKIVSFEKEIESISEWKLESIFFKRSSFVKFLTAVINVLASVLDPSAKQPLCFIFWLFCLKLSQTCQVVVQSFPRSKPVNLQPGVARCNLADCIYPWKQVSNYVRKGQSCLTSPHFQNVSFHSLQGTVHPDWLPLCGNTDRNTNSTNRTTPKTLVICMQFKVHIILRLVVLELYSQNSWLVHKAQQYTKSYVALLLAINVFLHIA